MMLGAQGRPIGNDSSTPLHLFTPAYPVPYGVATQASVKATTDKILAYLNTTTPARLENRQTHEPVSDYKLIDANTQLVRGDFRLASYEWGVTYSGMLKMAQITGDITYSRYVMERMDFLAAIAPDFKTMVDNGTSIDTQMNQILNPHALDDAGAVCAAMIRTAKTLDKTSVYRTLIDNYMEYILHKEIRLNDGTYARNRPFRNTVWLDDMYMSLPALAEYTSYTGDISYAEEAARQILLFRDKLFVTEKGLFRHGWVQDMNPHPVYHWGRANGWAILAICDVLDILAESSNRSEILSLLQAHLAGIAACQSGSGFWHQLLDRNDSYLETSCTAIFTYCLAHAVCEGWVSAEIYGPIAMLGWQAISTKITPEGRVEGTCVGTGMGFDPAFYYHRPISASAAHGYGPTLLAGAEIIRLLNQQFPKLNDSAVQFYQTQQPANAPIFSEE